MSGGIDSIIEANTKSVLLSKLQELGTTDLSYSIANSYPNLAKRVAAIPSSNVISGSIHGQEVEFRVPRSLFLHFLQIETTLTSQTTTGVASTHHLGLDLFEWVQVEANGKVLLRNSDFYTRARTVADSEVHKSVAVTRRALPLNPTTEVPAVINGGSTFKTYTPVYTTWFEDTRNNLDAHFGELLTIRARFNSLARMGCPDALGNGATCRLIIHQWKPIDRYYEMMRSKNMKPNGLYSILWEQNFREQYTCSSTTANSIRLNINYPVFKLYVAIRSNLGTSNAPFRKINGFTFRIGGLAIVESTSNLVTRFEQEYSGAGGMVATSETAVSRLGDYILVINFGLLPQDRTMNSGAISFAEINNPTLELTHETLATAAENEILVSANYWSILSTDPNNGTLSISNQS